MNTRVVTAYLPVEVAAKLDALADSLDRPRDTMAALAEVEAGLVVEHDEVEAWASGLGGRAGAKSRVSRAR